MSNNDNNNGMHNLNSHDDERYDSHGTESIPLSPISPSPTLHEFDLEAASGHVSPSAYSEPGPQHALAVKPLPDEAQLKEGAATAVHTPTEEHGNPGHDALGKEAQPHTPSHERNDAEMLQDQWNYLPSRQVILVFFGLGTALACAFLEQTMMATSLPTISASLGSGNDAPWIVTSYLLVSTAVTPLSSRFSDIFGRKVVMLVCLGMFWIFSIACAVAQTTSQMIVFRSLAGVGGGSLINLALIVISDIVSLRDRGKYQGIFEIVAAASGGLGPLIGGSLAEYNWRWIFWLCVIMCSFAIFVTWKILPLKKVTGDIKQKVLQIDAVGCVLVLAASVLVLLGLNWGNVVFPWVSAPVLVTLILGVGLFGAFATYELFIPRIPMVPMSIFKYRTVVGVCIMTIAIGAIQYCLLFYIPQWFQFVRGYSSLRSGLLLMPYNAIIAPTVLGCAQLIASTGHYRPQIYVGCVFWCISMGLLTTIDVNTPTSRVLGFEALAGIGAGCIFQTSLSALQAAVPRHEVSVATGARNFLRLASGTIFLAIGSSLINQSITNLGLPAQLVADILNDPPSVHTRTDISDATRNQIINAYQQGFRTVFWVLLGAVFVLTIAAVTLVQHHSLSRDDDAKLKAMGHKFMEERKMHKKAKKEHHGHEKEHDVEEGGSR